MFLGGGLLTTVFPPAGIPLLVSGWTTATASGVKKGVLKTVKQKRKIIKQKEYMVTYNIYSDGSKEESFREFIKEETTYGNWKDEN